MVVAFRYSPMKVLSHPVFLVVVSVLAGLAAAAWWYVRKQRSKLNELPTISPPEIARPGSTPAALPRPRSKHTPREVVQRALRRGDKALGSIEGSSLPFLDTSPLSHQEEQVEVGTAEARHTLSHASSTGP